MFKNHVILIHTVIALFISQSIFWLIYMNFDFLPAEIPLWFMQLPGPAQLARREWIWLLPGLAGGFLAVNLVFTALTHRRQPFLVGLVMSMSSIGGLFLLLSTINLLGRVLGWF